MALSAHLSELSEKHRILERKIQEEQARPAADETKISRWKLEKLKLKDLINKIETHTRH